MEEKVCRTAAEIDEARRQELERREPVKRLSEIYAEFTSRHTDRSLAVVAAALVHDMLATLLKSQLKHRDEEIDRLFRADGALGTFSTAIHMSYALGLISADVRSDLDYVRQIRNKFAHVVLYPNSQHQLRRLRFDTHKIKDWVSNLKCPTICFQKDLGQMFPYNCLDDGVYYGPQTTPQERYSWTCLCLYDILRDGVEISTPVPLDYPRPEGYISLQQYFGGLPRQRKRPRVLLERGVAKPRERRQVTSETTPGATEQQAESSQVAPTLDSDNHK